MTTATDFAPASFWQRYAAWSLDAACCLLLALAMSAEVLHQASAQASASLQALMAGILRSLDTLLTQPAPILTTLAALLAAPAVQTATHALVSALSSALGALLLWYALLSAGWALLFESSPWQATPGQRALGLRVTTARGERADWQHVLLRHGCAGLSWLTLNLGHLMAASSPYLALHDRFSGTRVVRHASASARLPAWARVWLGLQALACACALGWLWQTLQTLAYAAVHTLPAG